MNKRQLGTDYEDIASDYLQKAGYVILERNFRSKKGEIDIIAKEKNVIVFVEVKFRQSNSYGYSAEAVNYKKQMIIYRVAEAYLAYKKEFYGMPCRFDVIGFDNNKISHIKNFNLIYYSYFLNEIFKSTEPLMPSIFPLEEYCHIDTSYGK